MAVCRHCSGSQPSQGYGNSLDNCMSQSMTVRRPYAATTGPFDMEEASLSWGPELADCSRWDEAGYRWLRLCFLAQCSQFILILSFDALRPSSGIFMLAPVSTEPRSCPPWSKYGICCTLR